MAQAFDLIVVSIGYRKLVVPKKVAMAFFDLCAGADVYVLDSHWNDATKTAELHVRLATTEEVPTLSTIGPVQFHQAVENYEMHKESKS
jgi:hypothetical protein